MKCPVCDKENQSMQCLECGFDSSRDYGKYPTFGPVGKVPTVSALRKQWQEQDKPERLILNEPELTMSEEKSDIGPVAVIKKKPGWLLYAGAVLVLGTVVFFGSLNGDKPAVPETVIQEDIQTQPSELNNQLQQTESKCYLRADSERIKVGETTGVALIMGEYVYRCDDALIWSSDNPNVAVIGRDGVITAVSAGAAVITGKIDGYESTVTITVEDVPVSTQQPSGSQTEHQVTEIQVGCRTDVLLAGDTVDAYVKTDGFYLEGDSDGIEWSTDRPEIATVDSQGRVTGRKAGTFQLMAKYQGLSSSMEITVVEVDKTNGVVAELDYEKLSLRRGTSDTVNLTVHGDLPEHCGLTAYYSSGMQLSLEVGEPTNPIQLTIHVGFSEVSEGYVTILLYDRDAPSHVVATAKVQLKIN